MFIHFRNRIWSRSLCTYTLVWMYLYLIEKRNAFMYEKTILTKLIFRHHSSNLNDTFTRKHWITCENICLELSGSQTWISQSHTHTPQWVFELLKQNFQQFDTWYYIIHIWTMFNYDGNPSDILFNKRDKIQTIKSNNRIWKTTEFIDNDFMGTF